MSYEKTPGAATEPSETSGDLENPGWDTVEQFAGLGASENYDQHGPPGSQPETSDVNESFQLQVQLATELEHDAYRQATTHQPNESLIKEATWAEATNASLGNAKSAREAGDAERADSYLMAGLIIDWKYRGHCESFVKQAVVNGSAGELLGAVKDNSELVLKDPDSDYAQTINLELSNKLNLLELAVDHKIEAEEHSIELQQALTGEDRRDRISKLGYEDLVVLGRSPEVNQRDPELQVLAIKTAISEFQSSPQQYSYRKVSLSADIGGLAKARPDIFKNELDDEFRGLLEQRLATSEFEGRRRRRPGAGSIKLTLDTVVVDLWANGNSDIAAKMLTASSHESKCLERAARESEALRSWDNPARVEEVISEINGYIHQRQSDLHNTVSQYTAGLDHFLASSRPGSDSETLSRSLKSVFEPDNIDDVVDPEGYVELVTSAIPELITGLDTDQVGEVCEGLRSGTGPNKLRLAEAIQDPQTISSLADETYGLEMRRLIRDNPERLKEIATIVEDKRFRGIVEDCQLAQPDRIIRSLTPRRLLGSRHYGGNSLDIDSIATAFSDETNLAQALSQIPESIKLDFFSHAVRYPDQAIGLATALTDDGVTELLARDDRLQSDIARAVLQWEPELIPQKSHELLEALELIGEASSTTGKEITQTEYIRHVLNRSEDFLKTTTGLAEVLTNIELAGQLLQDDRRQSDIAWVVLRGEPELIPQKSRELLEAFKLLEGMPAVMADDDIKRMIQKNILDRSEDFLKTTTELAEALANTELAGLTLVALRLGGLPKDFSPDKLLEVVDRIIEARGIDVVVHEMVSLSPKEQEAAMTAVAKLAPPRLLIDIYCRSDTMPSTGEGVSQLTGCMELDERTSLAPAYFSEAIRRLPRSEGKPSFAIVFQEAMDTYSQIDNVLAGGEEATAMLERIQATLGSRGPGADRQSIALANAVIRQGRDPAEIRTALEAKAYPLHCLNRDLGLELDASESGIDQLTEKMGDLMPSMVYAASASQPVQTRLAEIITSLANNSYHHLKYPDRQPLIEAGILPPVDAAAYQRWQTTESTDSAEAVANTAVDVSDKIRQVVSSALSSYQQLEGFNHLKDPEAKIAAIGAALAQIGQQIGATHRQKQHGEITPEQAETAVAGLQAQKQQLELARDAVRLAGVTGPEVASGKLNNEDGRPTQATIGQTLDKLAAVDLGQSSETLGQLREVLDNYAAAATTDIGRIVVSDVDDYQTTFEIGANPVGSCQHYETGFLNDALLGYFEPGVKVVTVRNQSGGLLARAILRLAFDSDGSPAVVLEPTYAAQASNDIEAAVKDHARTKAANMGLELYNSRPRFADMTLPRLIAPYGYSDSFAGLYGSGS